LGLLGSGRGKPRWSVVRGWGLGDDWSVQFATGMKPTAWLFGSGATVCVGPPLFCNPIGSRFSVLLPLMLVALPNPHVVSSEML